MGFAGYVAVCVQLYCRCFSAFILKVWCLRPVPCVRSSDGGCVDGYKDPHACLFDLVVKRSTFTLKVISPILDVCCVY
jgi:hypothetical protein